MNAREQFQAAADLFLRARGLSNAERNSFLNEACGSNAELRSQVAALLATEEHSQVFATLADQLRPVHGQLRDHLPTTRASSGAPPQSAARLVDEHQPDALIGGYRLIEQVGEGGFGRVWVAEQRQPLQRRVAIKIIKAGMDSHEVLARFDAERQVLALMEHPSIARVFDAGVTDRGRPYFVMEYVPGLPITDHCNASRMRIRERLGIFIEVCQAVQHAHQRGIIHRDLKPSNVLVTLLDGRAVAKVIDFGIAKATTATLTDRPVMTETGRMMGTPEYMSPEQASSAWADLDTRSDVYSLGVILYQLLTGTLPFDPKMLREAGSDGIVKIIREMDPPRPSTRLSTMRAEPVNQHGGAAPEQLTRSHGTEARILERQLRGELDWIVMKCLEKDRKRRYESASGLAADVRRYLSGEPLVAAPPSASYQFLKFARRNRIVIGAVASVVASLLIGFVVSLFLYFQEREAVGRALAAETEQGVLRGQADDARESEARQRLSAERDRDQARIEAGKSERISVFLRDMLSAIQPQRARGNREITVAEALDEAARSVERGELHGEPEVEAAVRTTIGDTYRRLGRLQEGRGHLTAALEMRRAIHGEEHADVATNRLALSALKYDAGEFGDAETLCRAALETRQRLFAPESMEVAEARHQLGRACTALGRHEEARAFFDCALWTLTASHGSEQVAIMNVLSDLGGLYFIRGDYVAAEPLWQQILDQRLALFDENNPDVAICYNNLATIRSSRGDYPGAIEYHRKALELRRKLLGPGHPEVGHSLRNLATCISAVGDPLESAALYREAVAIQRASLGPDHPQLATTLEALGNRLRLNGELDDALTLQEEALAIRRRAFGNEHPAVAQAQHFLGIVLLDQMKLDQAETALQEASAMRRRTVGRADIMVAEGCLFLARIHRARKELDEAESKYREGLSLVRGIAGPDHPRTAQALTGLGNILGDKGDLAGAVAANVEAVGIFRRRGMGQSRDVATALYNLGVIHRRNGAGAEAKSVLEEALSIQQKVLPADDPAIADTINELELVRAPGQIDRP